MLRRALSGLRAGAAFFPSLIAYGALRVLMRVAPEPPAHPHTDDDVILIQGQHARRRLSTRLINAFVFVYQRSAVRDALQRQGRQCVYLPTCTEYAVRAVQKHGLRRGLLITGDRFRRCSEGGQGAFVDFP